jgi:hypothetical protein
MAALPDTKGPEPGEPGISRWVYEWVSWLAGLGCFARLTPRRRRGRCTWLGNLTLQVRLVVGRDAHQFPTVHAGVVQEINLACPSREVAEIDHEVFPFRHEGRFPRGSHHMMPTRRRVMYEAGPARPEDCHENRDIAAAGNGHDGSIMERSTRAANPRSGGDSPAALRR